MKQLVFFVEERSIKIVIDHLARRFAPERRVIVSPHEGKNDLVKSFPRKIKAWEYPDDALFVVMRDNDGANCVELKERLAQLVPSARRNRTRIRIVMQQLESWYFGDLAALEQAEFIAPGKAAAMQNSTKFRDPDRLNNASELFEKLPGTNGKLDAATRLGPLLDPVRSRSHSFKTVIDTLKGFNGP